MCPIPAITDHSSVTEYGLQVFTVGESSELQFNSQEMFPDRVSTCTVYIHDQLS